MEPEELQWLYETAQKMDSIVEIGSYKGRSTYVLCAGCPGKVYAVDWFCCGGIPPDPDPESQTWAAFFANVGHFPNLCPVRMTSEEAAKWGLPEPKMVDMVFIDGAHEEESVLLDLQLWTPRTKKLVSGHDLDHPQKMDCLGVRRALTKYCGMKGVQRGPGSIWFIEKG